MSLVRHHGRIAPATLGLLLSLAGCGGGDGGPLMVAPTCADGVRNGHETDVDCGGPECAPCGNGRTCGAPGDCAGGVCSMGVCAGASCTDRLKNGGETDVDCGGPECPKCGDGKRCGAATDCTSAACFGGRCILPSCSDGVKDAAETDVDCGGGTCPPCAGGKACAVASDCASGVCAAQLCAAPTCMDKVKNGRETDVDCGGPDCQPCGDGSQCEKPSDCAGGVCGNGHCAMPNCGDQVLNGKESDVDCGGPDCSACADGKACKQAADCKSALCTANRCVSPTCNDKIKNGDETDVDCGGAICPRCVEGQTCVVNQDCQPLPFICWKGHCSPGPFLDTLAPARAPTTGGLTVTATGRNFRNGMGLAVVVDGKPSPKVTFVSPTTVTFVVPADPGRRGNVAVALFNPDGQPAVGPAFIYDPGTINFAGVTLAAGNGPHWVGVGLIDHDQYPDLVTTDAGSSTISAHLNDLKGGFRPVVTSNTIRPAWGATLVDFDGDGDPDVVSALPSAGPAVHLGNSAGNYFMGVIATAIGSCFQSTAVGDMNLDGKLDIIAGSGCGATQVNYIAYTGTKNFMLMFAPPVAVNSNTNPVAVAVADFNLDKKPDIAVANQVMNGTISVMLGGGNGAFQAPRSAAAGTQTVGLATGDLNGDALPDVVAVAAGSNDLWLLAGAGDGTFQPGVRSAVGKSPQSVAIGDFNGDGVPDVTVANQGDNTIGILLGQGSKMGYQLQPMLIFKVGTAPAAVVVADFNMDGLSDVACANLTSNDVTVLTNTSK